MNKSRTFILVAASVLAVVTSSLWSNAKPIDYQLPTETAELKPGPNLETARNNCTACHSADYIRTQPQGPAYKKDFWQAEVTKMIKLYGAPIVDADVPKIVEYLSQTY
jgi:sulfite dehydrogenase (cytochrome) subunit B